MKSSTKNKLQNTVTIKGGMFYIYEYAHEWMYNITKFDTVWIHVSK